MRRCAVALFAFLILLTTRTALAADDTGFTFAPNLFLMQPRLASGQFSGSGVAYGDGSSTSFNHSGREIGVHAPVMLGAELRIGVEKRYYEIGVQLFGGTSLGDAGSASDPDAAKLADTGGMTMLGGGAHAMIAIPAGLVTFRIGPDFGVRGFELPLTGFEPTVCHTKYGEVSCPQTASYTQPYFQPKIQIVVQTDPKAKSGLFFGPWVGLDVVPAPSWAAGFMFGWGFDHNALR